MAHLVDHIKIAGDMGLGVADATKLQIVRV